jgi:antitoxin component YwqK of YwqJK toxin-antitoxin module
MNQKFLSRSILLIISIYSLLASCTKEVDYGSLVERNGIKYEVNSDEGYTGNSVGFYENGQKSIQCSFVDGKRHNSFQEWYENGQLKKDYTYANGILVGSYLEYFKSGQIQTNGEYIAGLRNGDYNEFWENGGKKFVGTYSMGKKNGEHLSLNEDEKIFKQETFLDDSLHGMRINYWEGGAVKDSGLFSNGKAINEHLFYYLDGQLQYKFSNDSTGNVISQENYDKNNNLSSLFKFQDNHIVQMKLYGSTGELSQIVDYSTYLGNDYERIRLFKSGMLYSDSGGMDGWEYWYWGNGNVREKYQKKNYERNGAYNEYKEDGTLWITGFYKNGKQTGLWKWYDKDGNVYTEDSFK